MMSPSEVNPAAVISFVVTLPTSVTCCKFWLPPPPPNDDRSTVRSASAPVLPITKSVPLRVAVST